LTKRRSGETLRRKRNEESRCRARPFAAAVVSDADLLRCALGYARKRAVPDPAPSAPRDVSEVSSPDGRAASSGRVAPAGDSSGEKPKAWYARWFDRFLGLSPVGGFSTSVPPEVTVANETRARLEIDEIEHGDLTLTLAPLEVRSVPAKQCQVFQHALERLAFLGYLKFSEVKISERNGELVSELEREHESRRRARAVYLAGFIYGGLAFVLWGLLVGTSWAYWALLAFILAAVVVVRLRDADVGVRAVQTVYLLVVVAVGIAMPVAAVWAGGDVHEVWDDAFNGSSTANEQEASLILLGRSIQALFIIVVTLLPGLLYFLFDRYRLSTLGEEFSRQIFRLDTSVRTRGDIHAKYGHLMEEAYGSDRRRGGSSRQQPGTRLPIVIATVVFALGWIVVLLNAEVDVDVIQTGEIRSLITPWQSATAFAFLGAYVFILQAALRAYLRGDLRPKFYSYAVLRVVVAVVFAWVLELIIGWGDGKTATIPAVDGAGGSQASDAATSLASDLDGTLLLVAAFAVGLVPDTFLLRLRELLRKRGFKLADITERHPLTDLEGIDIYDRARLEQEGVTNIEALAHSNLVELILQTRIPAGRLVDWTDQTLLYIHLQKLTDGSGQDAGAKEKRNHLREWGIRTASDLLVARAAAYRRGGIGELDKLLAALSLDGKDSAQLRALIDAISDDEWMNQIMDWHDPENRKERTLRYPQDFLTSHGLGDPLRLPAPTRRGWWLPEAG
jgi:hypothetical protein